jgi:HlyD family secretion protein
MRRLLNWLLILLGVSAIAAVIIYPTMAWWKERNAPKFLTAKVSRGRVETVVNSTGTIKPVRTVAVGAFTSGPIETVKVDFNSWITRTEDGRLVIDGKVQEEDAIALIDNKLQKAAVGRDQAAVDTQKAEQERVDALLEQAIRNHERAVKLQKTDPEYISATEMDQFFYAKKTLTAQLELAKASVRQAAANLQNSQEQLDYTKIKAPKEIDPAKRIKGIVTERKIDPGQTVAASFQTPELFTIALEMDKHVYLYASVDEADIGLIRAGKDRKPVEFTVDAYPGELFKGTIFDIRLNSTTTQNVVTYPVVIDAPNQVVEGPKPELKLKPGMTANITFQIDAKEDVLRLPVSALRFTPLPAHVHPDDQHYLESITAGQAGGGARRTASEKADMARSRHHRIVWIREGLLLRAVPVTLGLIEHRYAELLKGDLKDGDLVISGVEGAIAPK